MAVYAWIAPYHIIPFLPMRLLLRIGSMWHVLFLVKVCHKKVGEGLLLLLDKQSIFIFQVNLVYLEIT